MALSRSTSGNKVNDQTDSFRSRSPSIRYQPLQLDIETDVDARRKIFRQKQLKKLCWAGTLALFGFIMLIVGLNWYTVDKKGYTAFLLVGSIMFIPGAYGVYEVRSTIYLSFTNLFIIGYFYYFSRLLVHLMDGVALIN